MAEHAPAFRLEELDPFQLALIGDIPIAFSVTETALVEPGAAGRAIVGARPVDAPWVKDYDALPENHPTTWNERFDVANWGLIVARAEGRAIGSVLIALDTPEVEMLEGRRDLAVIWDLRVRPEWRGRGVGSGLVQAADVWARRRGCRELKVETQDIDVPACRLYVARGFSLRQVRPDAYPECPGETQLLWSKRLSEGPP